MTPWIIIATLCLAPGECVTIPGQGYETRAECRRNAAAQTLTHRAFLLREQFIATVAFRCEPAGTVV